jgi:hypothetical protein
MALSGRCKSRFSSILLFACPIAGSAIRAQGTTSPTSSQQHASISQGRRSSSTVYFILRRQLNVVHGNLLFFVAAQNVLNIHMRDSMFRRPMNLRDASDTSWFVDSWPSSRLHFNQAANGYAIAIICRRRRRHSDNMMEEQALSKQPQGCSSQFRVGGRAVYRHYSTEFYDT